MNSLLIGELAPEQPSFEPTKNVSGCLLPGDPVLAEGRRVEGRPRRYLQRVVPGDPRFFCCVSGSQAEGSGVSGIHGSHKATTTTMIINRKPILSTYSVPSITSYYPQALTDEKTEAQIS